MKQIFTLNAHKTCIGQSNFNPLQHKIKLKIPGTYQIKYISGAITSMNYDEINKWLSEKIQIHEPNYPYYSYYDYWNRYYKCDNTSSLLLKMGNYDISYFPTSAIYLGCFYCQYGILPGFTENGYKTRALADTFNSNYLNNLNNLYTYTDSLQFIIDEPEELVFWYSNWYQQSVVGNITYQIEQTSRTKNNYFMNDISILTINKQTLNTIEYSNYNYNAYKDNLYQNIMQSKDAWIKNIENLKIIKSITDFNTLGYLSAYIYDLYTSDTINYNKKYSQSYIWKLSKYLNNETYNLIGKFSKQDNPIILYPGTYTIFSASLNESNIKNIIQVNKIPNTSQTHFELNYLSYNFIIGTCTKLIFNDIFKSNQYSIYLYKNTLNSELLINYINNELKNNLNFIINIPSAQTDTSIINYFNEYSNFEYYINLQNHDYILKNTLNIYNAAKVINSFSMGPYNTLSTACNDAINKQLITDKSIIEASPVITQTQYNGQTIIYYTYKKENNL